MAKPNTPRNSRSKRTLSMLSDTQSSLDSVKMNFNSLPAQPASSLSPEQQAWVDDYNDEEQNMGRYAKDTGGVDFKQAPAGTHIARCIKLTDLGHQRGEYLGEPTYRDQVLVAWELCNEMMEEGKPFIVSAFLTNSLGEKAKLRAWLESWRSRSFTKEELGSFDLNNILGKPCMVTVVHSEKGKAQIAGVSAMPKGIKAPDPINPVSAFWIGEWDQGAFDAMSDGIKKIIMESDEYKARGKNGISDMKSDEPWNERQPGEDVEEAGF